MVSLATFTLLVAGCATVLGSSPARIEDFPSIVQLETGISRLWLQTCVGSILTSRHVLTAAHCLIGANLTPRVSRVRAGASQRGRDGQIMTVQSVIRHPSYNIKRLDGNVGIVRLQASLTFSSTVQQATIVAPGTSFPANVPVTIAGWGRTTQDVIWSDRDLYSADLFTGNHQECVEVYDRIVLFLGITITDNMICLTGPGTSGTHWGVRDGGSPVYYNGVLMGFASFGSPLGEKYPLIATSVSSYTNWIVENAN